MRALGGDARGLVPDDLDLRGEDFLIRLGNGDLRGRVRGRLDLVRRGARGKLEQLHLAGVARSAPGPLLQELQVHAAIAADVPAAARDLNLCHTPLAGLGEGDLQQNSVHLHRKKPPWPFVVNATTAVALWPKETTFCPIKLMRKKPFLCIYNNVNEQNPNKQAIFIVRIHSSTTLKVLSRGVLETKILKQKNAALSDAFKALLTVKFLSLFLQSPPH